MKRQTSTERRTSKKFEQPIKSKAPLSHGRAPSLKETVKKHGVSWDLWPEYHVDREGRLIQIGFEFNLIGASHHLEDIIEPGCPQCMEAYEDLRGIAEWITPKNRQNGVYEILITDASPYYSSYRRLRAEVLLAIRVISREGLEGNADACDAECVMEMKTRAEELGIPKHAGLS